MVKQNVGQRFGIGQQALDSAFRQCGERLVGGSEDSQRAVAAQCVFQTSGLNGGHQGVKAASSNGRVNDVLGHGVVSHRAVVHRSVSGRQDDRIDDMDHAVGCFDVGGNDVGVVDHRLAIDDGELHSRALQRAGFEAIGHAFSHYLTIDHVVEQDSAQCFWVGQQTFDSAFGQGRERLVRGSEDGQRTVAAQRIFQTSGLNGGHQGVEAAGGNRGINNILSHFGFGRGFGFGGSWLFHRSGGGLGGGVLGGWCGASAHNQYENQQQGYDGPAGFHCSLL